MSPDRVSATGVSGDKRQLITTTPDGTQWFTQSAPTTLSLRGQNVAEE